MSCFYLQVTSIVIVQYWHAYYFGLDATIHLTVTSSQIKEIKLINLDEIKVLAWDIGGTVFDWRGTIQCELEKIAEQQDTALDTYQFASDWRYGMFEMLAKVRNGDLPSMNADEIHRKILDTVLETHVNISLTTSERDELNGVWHKLNAWPDAPKAIQRLRTRYTVVPLTVLSWSIGVDCSKYNGISWDGLISCEFLRDYKPDPGSYLHAAELLQVKPSEIMMCAAHTNDLKAAKQVGFRTAFVLRESEIARDTMAMEPTEPLDFFDVTGMDFSDLTNKLLA